MVTENAKPGVLSLGIAVLSRYVFRRSADSRHILFVDANRVNTRLQSCACTLHSPGQNRVVQMP